MGKMDAWIYLAYGDRSHLSGECSVWLKGGRPSQPIVITAQTTTACPLLGLRMGFLA